MGARESHQSHSGSTAILTRKPFLLGILRLTLGAFVLAACSLWSTQPANHRRLTVKVAGEWAQVKHEKSKVGILIKGSGYGPGSNKVTLQVIDREQMRVTGEQLTIDKWNLDPYPAPTIAQVASITQKTEASIRKTKDEYNKLLEEALNERVKGWSGMTISCRSVITYGITGKSSASANDLLPIMMEFTDYPNRAIASATRLGVFLESLDHHPRDSNGKHSFWIVIVCRKKGGKWVQKKVVSSEEYEYISLSVIGVQHGDTLIAVRDNIAKEDRDVVVPAIVEKLNRTPMAMK